jgi:hypothetical protein
MELFDDKGKLRALVCQACYGKIMAPLISTNEVKDVLLFRFHKLVYPDCCICRQRACVNIVSRFPFIKRPLSFSSPVKGLGYIDKTTVFDLALCSRHIKPFLASISVPTFLKYIKKEGDG